LQRVCVDWDRERARQALETSPEKWNNDQRHAIRMLSVSVHELAEVQRAKADPACANAYREAFDLASAIGYTAGQAVCAFNLCHAYIAIADLRNLDEAERWSRKSLDLHPPGDALGRARSIATLGAVFYSRFMEAMAARRPGAECARHLAEGAKFYEQALEMLPESAVTDRGGAHLQLGGIYFAAGDSDSALKHLRQAVRYFEGAGDLFGAGQTRFNAAVTLLSAGRLDDARSFAEAALANFQTFGERAAADIQNAVTLIADIDKAG
jgi:tetratricopeptide (TPR) repeat protein